MNRRPRLTGLAAVLAGLELIIDPLGMSHTIIVVADLLLGPSRSRVSHSLSRSRLQLDLKERNVNSKSLRRITQDETNYAGERSVLAE